MVGDYVTIAYYDHYQNRGLEQVAYDKTRIYFEESPPLNQPPDAPDVWASFHADGGYISLNWASSTDPDSPDEYLYYETNISKTPEFNGERWVKYPRYVYYEPGYLPFWTTEPGAYYLAVRVYDEFEAMTETVKTVTIDPLGETVLPPPP